MRHRKAGRKLGRNASHRLALYRNLALALFRNERIITTLEKAKAVRPFVEKLITLAKKGTLHARRLAVSRMGPSSDAEVKPATGMKDDKPDERTIMQKLFSEIAARFQDRPGGYTRIIRRHERRLGDAGRTAYLELLKAGETKQKK
ncbi:MAG: 50S ribosomal protein L17, partial [Gemmataceae bacterium]|nr:50S ribosomal protein L17 [Gemmataceae bacterium]